MTSFLLTAGEAASFGERMGRAGLNTLLGMGMAFFVLIIIMLVIMLFPMLFGEKKPKETRVELAEKSMTNTITQIEEHEALEDDTELVAAIAAAIAAYEGRAGTDGLVIRSIRQRSLKKQWQRA